MASAAARATPQQRTLDSAFAACCAVLLTNGTGTVRATRTERWSVRSWQRARRPTRGRSRRHRRGRRHRGRVSPICTFATPADCRFLHRRCGIGTLRASTALRARNWIGLQHIIPDHRQMSPALSRSYLNSPKQHRATKTSWINTVRTKTEPKVQRTATLLKAHLANIRSTSGLPKLGPFRLYVGGIGKRRGK